MFAAYLLSSVLLAASPQSVREAAMDTEPPCDGTCEKDCDKCDGATCDKCDISSPQLEDLTLAIKQMREDNANLQAQIADLKHRLVKTSEFATGVKEGEVPEWDITQKTAGQWHVHPEVGIPVYTQSVWIERSNGKSLVRECIQIGNKPVPVPSIVYGRHKLPPYAGEPATEYNRPQQSNPVFPPQANPAFPGQPGIAPGQPGGINFILPQISR